MEDKEITNIKLKQATKMALADLKIHPRQSYDEIIKQILDKIEGENTQDESPADSSKEETQ